jgi:N-methylhydantoinase A
VSAAGVDTGGTFTDFVAVAGGRLVTWKEPSTPAAPERAVLAGLARLGASRATRVRHGSTVATNALLERKGARVVFLTDLGFEDLLEIGRQDRPSLYALAPRRVEPLVPAARRIGVRARSGPDGRVLAPLGRAELRRALRRAARARPEAVAVGLLHAYASPRAERALARAARSLGVPVTAASELCPEIREYERFATTVVNAYLLPRVSRYLRALAARTGPALEIVLSHGGAASAREAAREPVRQLLSGPAAGLWAAWRAARACGFTRALTLDVGGTSTDVAFASGRLPRRRAREVAGFPILLPLLDVHSVGAGGGSIARLDAGGLLEVGPESAGAVPGPACYGRGGPATVTDAMLVLGRLPFASLGEGAVRLDPAAARRALEPLARGLGLGSAGAAAEAVVAIANARMEAALRRVSVEAGHDPRGAALVAFGGAGGLHACALAESLAVEAVVFPAHAGVLSAIGALAGPERRERSLTVMLPADAPRGIERAIRRLERDVLRAFPGRGRAAVERRVLARYVGQSHELDLPFGPSLVARFHREHAGRYGFARPGAPVEVVTVEVSASLPRPLRARAGAPARGRAPGRIARGLEGAPARGAPVVGFDSLRRGSAVAGPTLVLQAGSTLWIPGGWRGRLHPSGALVLRRGGRR